jgi:hypothetical protein
VKRVGWYHGYIDCFVEDEDARQIQDFEERWGRLNRTSRDRWPEDLDGLTVPLFWEKWQQRFATRFAVAPFINVFPVIDSSNAKKTSRWYSRSQSGSHWMLDEKVTDMLSCKFLPQTAISDMRPGGPVEVIFSKEHFTQLRKNVASGVKAMSTSLTRYLSQGLRIAMLGNGEIVPVSDTARIGDSIVTLDDLRTQIVLEPTLAGYSPSKESIRTAMMHAISERTFETVRAPSIARKERSKSTSTAGDQYSRTPLVSTPQEWRDITAEGVREGHFVSLIQAGENVPTTGITWKHFRSYRAEPCIYLLH